MTVVNRKGLFHFRIVPVTAATDKMEESKLGFTAKDTSVSEEGLEKLLASGDAGQAEAGEDVNGDGAVNTSDAVLILQYAAEKIAAF